MTGDCLRYLYRLLFVFYMEARPELDYSPFKSDQYRLGYSLESLRDIEMTPLISEESRNGYYISESLDLLFNMVFQGFEPDRKELLGGKDIFSIPPLKSHLFDPERTPIISKCQFRNSVLQKVINLLSLSSGRRSGRRGRVSYARLGINQLGAVYEGLLSYSGFFVREEGGLYEVKKAGEQYDELQNAYFVPASELANYSEDEKFIPQFNPETGNTDNRLKKYERGDFIYRLAGRNRDKSASFYTPESLTQCVVKYSLKELLKDKKADDLLKLTICEPAVGSGAFTNEAVNQLAEAYLDMKQKETGKRISHDEYLGELQKVKAYIAGNNVYGVDLNPIAVELAEVSIWLSNICHDSSNKFFIPWLNMQLVAGNSLIGARRQAFDSKFLTPERGEKSWLDEVPVRYHLKSIDSKKGKRPSESVYHFLLPDSGMADYADKVVKQMFPEEIAKIKEWRKSFCKNKFETMQVEILERLSDKIDALWKRHIADRKELRRKTRDPWKVWEQPDDGSGENNLTTQQKDKLFRESILAENVRQSSAYRRLKLAMDYWCALWFWPLEKADQLPTREEYLLELQALIEGNVFAVEAREGDQYLMTFNNMSYQPDLANKDEFGYVNVDELIKSYKRLGIVAEIAKRCRFHHWELEFADLFAEKGGFDLVVGNPPWIKIEWNEGGVLGDFNPRFIFDDLSASDISQKTREAFSKYPKLRETYVAEYEEAEGTQNFLNAFQNYSLLTGMKANLYKCFLPQAWLISSEKGVTGFIHPEGVYDDPSGGRIRQAIYLRLKYHFQFQNALNLFAEVAHREKYSINIYSNILVNAFVSMSNLFNTTTIDRSFDYCGQGLCGGIKDEFDNWNLKGHKSRIIEVNEEVLALFAKLYDDPGTPALQARLPVIHSREVISVIEKFANCAFRLNNLKDDYYSTIMWNETQAQKEGVIRRSTRFANVGLEWILSGPHFYVGNPYYKTPRRVCIEKSDYDVIDLNIIPDDYLPRTNYAPIGDQQDYIRKTTCTPWNNQPVTNLYRLVFRAMLGQPNEHTLFAAIAPTLCGHINGVRSYCFSDDKMRAGLLFGAYCCSLPFDFFVKSTGKTNLHQMLDSFPLLIGTIYDSPLLFRMLSINSLTSRYDKLWVDNWSDSFKNEQWTKSNLCLDNKKFSKLTKVWTRDCALRSDYERRQALIEIDVLSAMALRLTCSELCAIYRIQFPVLKENESDTWYDQNGRIIFTCSKGLSGVGLGRPEWEKETQLNNLGAFGLKVEGVNPADFKGIKEMKSGTVTLTTTDDTIKDYRFAHGVFRKDCEEYICPCPDHLTPIEGPVERDITYIAPFTKCDREEDYKTAWEFFERRKDNA
ncbi:MAG: hypothetical protein WAX69_04710 [Victivallales bacterium]